MISEPIVFRNGQLTLSERKIFSGLSVEIAPGDFVCILGPSGCGKSSLLRLIAGLIKLDQFEHQRLPPSVGFVFQDSRLLPWLTVKENMTLSFHQKISDGESTRWLKILGLEQAADLFPHQISGGMKQRVAIGRALLKNPTVLLLDEPFAALDEPTREDLQTLLYQLWSSQKMTVVFVTHSPSEAAFLSQRILVMMKHGGGWQADLSGINGDRNSSRRLEEDVLVLQQKLSQFLRANQGAMP